MKFHETVLVAISCKCSCASSLLLCCLQIHLMIICVTFILMVSLVTCFSHCMTILSKKCLYININSWFRKEIESQHHYSGQDDNNSAHLPTFKNFKNLKFLPIPIVLVILQCLILTNFLCVCIGRCVSSWLTRVALMLSCWIGNGFNFWTLSVFSK